MKIRFQRLAQPFLVLSTLTIIIGMPGCKKEDSGQTESQKSAFAMVALQSDAESELIFDGIFDNVMGVSDEVGVGGTGIFGSMKPGVNTGNEVLSQSARTDSAACFVVTTTQLGGVRFPLKVVVDFGAGCLCRDGRTRKGKIVIVYTGRLLIPGNSATVAFDGYVVSDIQVEGSYNITNTGTADTKQFTQTVSNAKLTRPNGNYSFWNSEKTITQMEGALTPLIVLDDVFQVTGRANGSAKKDDQLFQWSTQITDPLIKRFSCFWIVEGTIGLRKSNTAVAVLAYGSGSCDNKATFTVNGAVHEITLH